MDAALGTTTSMMVIFFGINAVLFLVFQLTYYLQKRELNSVAESSIETKIDSKDHPVKELSKPFTGSISCWQNITIEWFRTGLIMATTYICEKHWIFDHSGKQYSRDLFMFILIIFFAYGFYTIRPIQDLSILSRDQTEEWKGWMQFIFLLYHYFHAEEVYNSVRVMITCYVWMTGFGNLQFFYVKRDYGWLRVVQMLWRLNFSVLFLMWTHGNTWILYYICPMHTFYFLMVYVTMYVGSHLNHSKWEIRGKIFLVGILIYVVWDINHGIFDFLFGWMGTESMIGATSGSVWEYYFRTSLDHWSSYLGMIFAINYPLVEQYYQRASTLSLTIASVLFLALSIWWIVEIYTLSKIEYNLVHSYYAIIPLTAYIFFRNITPWIRSGVSMSMHDLGKTTLETYLLQHHVWLTSNAKTLLTIVPGHPWINFALATILFFLLAKELYRLTMSLRGMILPDDQNIAFYNSLGLTIILTSVYAIAYALTYFEATLVDLLLTSLGSSIIALLLINFSRSDVAENHSFQYVSRRAYLAILMIFSLGLYLRFTSSSSASDTAMLHPWSNTKYRPDASCFDSISKGHWIENNCDILALPKLDRRAFCETDEWVWDVSSSSCPIASISSSRTKSLFKNKKILFVGDSILRSTYHQVNHLLDPQYDQFLLNSSFKHASLQQHLASNTLTSFIWTSKIDDAVNYLSHSNHSLPIDLLVLGMVLNDALTVHDMDSFLKSFDKLKGILQEQYPSSIKIWLQPTTIVNYRLTSAEKQKYMNEETIAHYRQAITSRLSADSKTVKLIIDPTMISKDRQTTSVDGIQYGPEVYAVIAQVSYTS
jgi:N-acetylneuraminate 9-O-acetyltransferase